MFQTAAGVTVPFPDKLREQYVREGDRITLNLSFEKLNGFVAAFFKKLDAPLFLALHVPADETHDRLYYLDGISAKQMRTLWQMYGELLCQDGLSAFAIASHETGEELFVQKYKIISLYSPRIERFAPLLEQYGVTETDTLVTAWDTFSEEHPGSLRLVDIEGETVLDAVEQLRQIGLYEAAEE